MTDFREERPNIDEVSGICLDGMSMAIYTFFPESKRPYLSREFNVGEFGPDDINYLGLVPVQEKGFFIHQCGSVNERLELPKLMIADGKEWLCPDFDIMYSFLTLRFLVGDQRPIGSYLKMETLSNSPGFCRVIVRSKSPNVNKVTTLQYLDRLKLQVKFKESVKKLWDQCSTPTIIKSSREPRPDDPDRASFPALLHQPYSIGSKPSVTKDMEYDLVISLQFKCPKQIEKTFLERVKDKHFPALKTETLKKLFKDTGCHVVPKYDPKSKQPETQWRISFSVIERDLANTLSDMQRTCYRVLKAVVRSEINDKVPKEQKLATYYLKTTLFWLCEETPLDSWTLNNLGNLWFKLVDKFIYFLQRGILPNYFIANCNLLDKESPIIMSVWMEHLLKIRKDPFNAFRSFWKSYKHLEYYIPFFGFSFNPFWLDRIQTDGIISKVSSKNVCFEVFKALQHYFMAECNLTDLLRLIDDFASFPFARWYSNYLTLTTEKKLIFLLTLYQQRYEKPGIDFDRQGVDGYFASLLLSEMGNISLQLGLQGSPHWIMEAGTFFEKAMEIDISQRHIGTAIKYANYLRAIHKYETAVEVLQQAFIYTRDEYWAGKTECNYSKFLPDIVDMCQQIELVGEDETTISSWQLAYHLLFVSYIQAGVFAEVCVTDQSRLTHGNYIPLWRSAGIFEYYDCLKYLGYQYLESGMFRLAAECFIRMLDTRILRKITWRILQFTLSRYATLHVIS